MKPPLLIASAILCLFVPLFAEEGVPPPPKPAADSSGQPAVPADLIDQGHMNEELGVNEFTAPSIAKVFDTLQAIMPIPLSDAQSKLPDRMPEDRANIAIDLGFQIADGFIIVESGQLDKVESLATTMTSYGKALGISERVNRHAAPLLEYAKKNELEPMKKELAAMQGDVQAELLRLKDADLAHLISLGGWIRALEVASVAVDKRFTPERAKAIMREDIADYYTESIAGLAPSISERPNFLAMRDILAGLRQAMTLGEDASPTKQQVDEIRVKAQELANLALTRR